MKFAGLAALVAVSMVRSIHAEPVVLRDDVNVIPAGQWRYDVFVLKDQLPALVDCVYTVTAPGHARVELITRENLQELLQGRRYQTIAASGSGQLRREINFAGEFALVVRNLEGDRDARVTLRLSLVFPPRTGIAERYLSPGRKLAVILFSFFGFLTVITLSARKLLLAMRRQGGGGVPP